MASVRAGRPRDRAGGAKLAFGEHVDTHYDFRKADVVLSLDADFLLAGPGTLRYARDFSDAPPRADEGHDTGQAR